MWIGRKKSKAKIKSAAPSTEAALNRKLKDAFKKLGINVFDIEDKRRASLPDLYIEGGIWMELKSVPMPNGTTKNLLNVLRQGQKLTALNIANGSDHMLLAYQLFRPHAENRPYLLLCDFLTIYRRWCWSWPELEPFLLPLDDVGLPEFLEMVGFIEGSGLETGAVRLEKENPRRCLSLGLDGRSYPVPPRSKRSPKTGSPS